jgi:hypothetical protein
MPKIAIIIGSTRPGRNGEAVAAGSTTSPPSATMPSSKVVDLNHVDLPHEHVPSRVDLG